MRKLSQQEVICRFNNVHGDKYDYSKFIFININTKGIIICKLHGEFAQTPKNHFKQNCPQCVGNNIQKTTKQFIQEALIVHENLYDYSKVNYTNNINKIIIICRIHGEFNQAPVEHLAGAGCKNCANNKYRKNIDIFIKESHIKHNNKYCYDKFIYINSITKSIIICPTHGEFKQSPNQHLEYGCRACGYDNMKISNEEFKIKCNIIHNNIYNYDNIIVTGMLNKVIINCLIHGDFIQKAHKHLEGAGCPKCNIINKTHSYAMFVTEANKIHNNLYIYDDNDNYLTKNHKTKIECKLHGTFKQQAMSHLLGAGCPSCSHRISKPEIAWLNSLNIPQEYRQAKLIIKNKLIKPDAYDPNTNTIYEFYGDFWHGNPTIYKSSDINSAVKKTFGELYQNTLVREEMLKAAGYNVISIWESDFNPAI